MTRSDVEPEAQPAGLQLSDWCGGYLWSEWWIACAACGREELISDGPTWEDAATEAREAGWHGIRRADGTGHAWVCPDCWPEDPTP
jgi:hypothetical protein